MCYCFLFGSPVRRFVVDYCFRGATEKIKNSGRYLENWILPVLQFIRQFPCNSWSGSTNTYVYVERSTRRHWRHAAVSPWFSYLLIPLFHQFKPWNSHQTRFPNFSSFFLYRLKPNWGKSTGRYKRYSHSKKCPEIPPKIASSGNTRDTSYWKTYCKISLGSNKCSNQRRAHNNLRGQAVTAIPLA